jgi:hypothetical protein
MREKKELENALDEEVGKGLRWKLSVGKRQNHIVVISILTYPILDSEVSYWVKRVKILIYTRLFLYS